LSLLLLKLNVYYESIKHIIVYYNGESESAKARERWLNFGRKKQKCFSFSASTEKGAIRVRTRLFLAQSMADKIVFNAGKVRNALYLLPFNLSVQGMPVVGM